MTSISRQLQFKGRQYEDTKQKFIVLTSFSPVEGEKMRERERERKKEVGQHIKVTAPFLLHNNAVLIKMSTLCRVK